MSNHFHLVVETPRANLVVGMKWLLWSYTMRFNRRHRLSGHVFAGLYKSLLIDESDPFYLRAVCDYVHLNPARARLIKEEELLQNYPWSSYPFYLKGRRDRPQWMRCDRLLGEHGLGKETRRTRMEFSRRTERLRGQADGVSADRVGGGCLMGREVLIIGLLVGWKGPLGDRHGPRDGRGTEEELPD